MTYKEFRKTYGRTLKKWPELSALFDRDIKVTIITENYSRNSITGRWKLIDTETEVVNTKYYLNSVDAYWFFKNLSSYERNVCGYTKYGYIPVESISISPDRYDKTVRKYIF